MQLIKGVLLDVMKKKKTDKVTGEIKEGYTLVLKEKRVFNNGDFYESIRRINAGKVDVKGLIGFQGNEIILETANGTYVDEESGKMYPYEVLLSIQ